MVPDRFPQSLLVVGSGAIGIEFASFYKTLGAEVTVVEILDRVLPAEDEEIAAFAAKAFTKQGMKLETGTQVTELEKGAENVTCILKDKTGKTRQVTVDRVILAMGIVGNVENIGLEEAGIEVAGNHVVAGAYGETGVNGVWAIGDLVGGPWLAHKAMHEGVIVAEKIAGVKGLHPLDTENVPGCTYCWPQIASVGLTEVKAKASGRNVKVGRFSFVGNGKAAALGEADGFIKTIFDATSGELLGAHMVGAEVTELIHGYVIAKTGELTDSELSRTIFPHPTLSEMIHEAVLAADGAALHL
jgi:dihydrolipoamide dehydrogenase